MSKEELRHGGMNIPGIEKGCVINTQRTLLNYLVPNLICEIHEPSRYHDLPSQCMCRLSMMTMKCSERNHL